MESQFLPICAAESIDGSETDSVFYIHDELPISGDFNSIVYNGLFKGKQILIKKLPGIFQDCGNVLKDIATVKDIGKHENLLRYFGGSFSGHQIFLAMEHCETNLSILLQKNEFHLPPLNIIQQTTAGLEFLHQNKIVHGNLKPSNILISYAKPLVKLSDFGMTSIYNELRETFWKSSILEGVIDWMAPEQIQRYKRKDFDTNQSFVGDIFALGCIFYFTISNEEHPFGDILERCHRILKNNPFLDEIIIKPFYRPTLPVISRMISADIQCRPSAQELMEHPVFWTKIKKTSFIKDLLVSFGVNEEVRETMLQLESMLKDTDIMSWKIKLDSPLILYLGEEQLVVENNLASLLTVMKYINEHSLSFPDHIKAICENSSTAGIFLENNFPYCVEILWTYFSTFENSGDMVKYYKYKPKCSFSSFIIEKYPGLRTLNSTDSASTKSPTTLSDDQQLQGNPPQNLRSHRKRKLTPYGNGPFPHSKYIVMEDKEKPGTTIITPKIQDTAKCHITSPNLTKAVSPSASLKTELLETFAEQISSNTFDTNFPTDEYINHKKGSGAVTKGIGIEDLILLSNNCNIIPPLPPYYIQRTLSRRNVVNPNMFQVKCLDTFVFINLKGQELSELVHPNLIAWSGTQLQKVTSKFILLECWEDWEQIKKIAVSPSPLHLIKYEDEQRTYVLLETSYRSATLEKFLEQDRLGILEDQFINLYVPVNIAGGACICDSSGTGKSLFLASLAHQIRKRFSNILVVHISLVDLLHNLHPSQIWHTYTGLKLIFKNIYPQQIIQDEVLKLVDEGSLPFIACMDGFENLSEHDVYWIKTLLQIILKKQNVKLFIAARSSMRQELEHILGVISYSIQPFTLTEQQEFLARHRNTSLSAYDETKFNEFFDLYLNKLNNSITQGEREILGIPLQCYMLAEIYSRTARLCAHEGKSFSPIAAFFAMDSPYLIYKEYIHSTIEMGLSLGEKVFTNANSVEFKTNIRTYHQWKALELLLPEIADDFASQTKLNKKPANLNYILSFGILRCRDMGNDVQVEFVHQSFAEFLLVDVFVNFINQSYDDTDKLLSEDYTTKVIKCFVNAVLSTWWCANHSLSLDFYATQEKTFKVSAPLYKFKHFSLTYFLNGLLETVLGDAIMKLGHFLSSVNIKPDNLYRILMSSIFDGHQNIFALISQQLEKIENLQKSNLKSFFLEKSYYITRDVYVHRCYILLCVSAQYSNVAMVMECVRFCSNDCFNYDFKLDGRYMPRSLNSPLHSAVRRGNYEMVEFLAKYISLEKKCFIYHCMHNSYWDEQETTEAKIKICKLFKMKAPETILESAYDMQSNKISGPIITYNANVNLVKLLIEDGADVFAVRNQETVLITAAKYMSLEDFYELCRFLIHQIGALGLFKKNLTKWENPIPCLLKKPRLITEDIINLILGVPQIKSELDEAEGNLIISAVYGNQSLEVIRTFVRHGIDYNVNDKYDKSVLHLAAALGNIEVLDYFISMGLSLGDQDEEGNTPFLCAYKHLEVIKFLANHHANICDTDGAGNNVLHKAALEMSRKEFHELVVFLLEHNKGGILLTSKNVAADTPLQILLRSKIGIDKETLILLLLQGIQNNSVEGGGSVLTGSTVQETLLVLRLMLGHSIDDKNIKTKEGKDEHVVVKLENAEIVEYLKSCGLYLCDKDNTWKTPLELAL